MSTDTDKDVKRRYWQLREDDQRTLYITVIGGLAANVGAVVIVGLALWIVREGHHHKDLLSKIQRVGWAQAWPLDLAVAVFFVAGAIYIAKPANVVILRIARAITFIGVAFVAVFLTVGGLAAIGDAAGIK